MDINEQILETVKKSILKDIVANKEMIAEILSKYQLTMKQIPQDLIQSIMNQLNTKEVRPPVKKAPKVRGTVARPIAVGEGQVSQIVSDLLEGNNVYLKGKAGTGKTYLAKAVAGLLRQPVYQINCSQWTSPIQIVGGQTIKGYVEGELIKAWANGGICILDELPKLDPNTAGLLNEALADAADQPKYDEEGNITSIPTITNGRGEKIEKGQAVDEERLAMEYEVLDEKMKAEISKEDYIKEQMDARFRFVVIGTGNTDMMNVGNKYGGNQRQDYSLVDRFSGSFYEIGVDIVKEKSLTYNYVFSVCDALRTFLNSKDALQSVSLRTMLNFNRTFEQQMLYKNSSVFADEIFGNDGERVEPKTIQNSISSFTDLLEDSIKDQLLNGIEGKEFRDQRDRMENEGVENKLFIKEFKKRYHFNLDGEELTQEEIIKLDLEN